MKVQVFAGLKDYFDPVFEVDQNVQSVDDLKQELIRMKPSSAALLQSCRFAVNEDLVDDNFDLTANDSVIILPPSSGG